MDPLPIWQQRGPGKVGGQKPATAPSPAPAPQAPSELQPTPVSTPVPAPVVVSEPGADACGPNGVGDCYVATPQLGGQARISLPVRQQATDEAIPANTITFGEPVPVRSADPGRALSSGPQPTDPRLRPAHPLDDRWSRMPGALPSASVSLYSDKVVEFKAGLDGSVSIDAPLPQLHAVGLGTCLHVSESVDLNAALRLPAADTTGTKTQNQGQGGYVGIGVHW